MFTTISKQSGGTWLFKNNRSNHVLCSYSTGGTKTQKVSKCIKNLLFCSSCPINSTESKYVQCILHFLFEIPSMVSAFTYSKGETAPWTALFRPALWLHRLQLIWQISLLQVTPVSIPVRTNHCPLHNRRGLKHSAKWLTGPQGNDALLNA